MAAAYHCPDDVVKRNFEAVPISFSLNLGHIWNTPRSPTNRKEWGTASVITGESVLLSIAPVPTETTWIFEYHSPDNNYRQLCDRNDRALFTTYTLDGFHEQASRNTMLFLDGRVERIDKATWKRGDNRGILFKNIHQSENCSPNLR